MILFIIETVAIKRNHFLNKKIIMKCLAIKFLHEFFYNSQFKKFNCNSTHNYNRKIWVDIPSYIIFPCSECVISEKSLAKVFNFPYIRKLWVLIFEYNMGNDKLNWKFIFPGIFSTHDVTLSSKILLGWQKNQVSRNYVDLNQLVKIKRFDKLCVLEAFYSC